ncbi:hypothetical protein MHU86_14254 [Fragilaria crotonensis]|nr:hypothetical protein MHU86_14254 [Fragilaria crotonensis]
MTKLCFGDDTDTNTISYVDQFLHGLNRFKGLFSNFSPTGDGGALGKMSTVLSIPPLLHRQGAAVHVFIGEGSIERAFLCSKSLANQTTPITGRTLLRLAKEVLCNCKKMQALVTRRDSPYKDMHYIPSGTNWEDYIKWCLSAMYKAECGRTEGELVDTLTSTSSTTSNEKGQSDARSNDNNATSPPDVEENDVNEGHDFPSNYFFKGFLAWCLWGWLPIQQGSAMKSSLFSDAKCNASLGRNTTSRQAIKERKESVAARSSTPQQHTMAIRPQQSLTARQQSDMLVELRHATKDVMQKTYELFEAEFVEKEQQKTAFLEVRIIRDNLASLTRKQDLLLQKYYHSTKALFRIR